jgi:hypothetical protein
MTFDPLTQIPPKGETIDRAVIMADHPQYTQGIDLWMFLRHSHELTGGFAPYVKDFTSIAAPTLFSHTFLVPHEKEDAADLNRRVAHATPPRFVRDGIAATSGVLLQQSARRTYPPALEEWMAAVTISRESWDTWLGISLIPALLRYGFVYVLPHRPAIEALNMAQYDEAGLPPVVVDIVSPEALRAWEYDDVGQLLWARYTEDRMDSHGPLGTSTDAIKRHWWITALGWFAVDDLSAASAAGSNDALVVVTSGHWLESQQPLTCGAPLAAWEFPDHVGPTHIAATKQLEYYRTESDLRKLETATAFSQVWVPVASRDQDPSLTVKGPDIVGGFPYDAKHTPLILSPDSGPFAHFSERLSVLRSECMEAYGLGDPPSGATTGIALAHTEVKATNLYRLMGQVCAKGEASTMRVVSQLLGVEWNDDMRPVWPKEFGALASTKTLENVETFAKLEPGDEYMKLAIKAAASALMPDLSAAEIELADAGIVKAQQEKAEQKKKDAEMMADSWGSAPQGDEEEGAAATQPKKMEGAIPSK